MRQLSDIASVIRSKNAGPYALTFDILFKTQADFERAVGRALINPDLIARLYGLSPQDVLSIIAFPPAHAIKATIRRPLPSGAVGDTDIYGAQQHAPLLSLPLDPDWP
ncbi:DUF4387 domain-containing protein [Aliishimia ponticola]|uniref:DUF4387 domain-containing protein n=1 Tax=Aliishimia ponticola TaxID=2499833 RepID=A0A4S4N9F6_9RHOB|nr:DUF4387 domain-containing protein [Aliishimia ponticola]THH35876.1 DUF4387 domain-containing protein [Aliishimia ponticola]